MDEGDDGEINLVNERAVVRELQDNAGGFDDDEDYHYYDFEEEEKVMPAL